MRSKVYSIPVRDYFETYTWCYIFLDESTGHGFLIDPGAEAKKIISMIEDYGWIIEKILLTHGHFDHTGAVREISDTIQIPYMIYSEGEKYLKSTHYNLSKYCNRNVILEQAEYFQEGDTISLSENPDCGLTVIHVPGHTEDSVLLYDGKSKAAFVGDTIFQGSIGTYEYPGGNKGQLQESIIEKVFQLPGETILYPGHSEATTVEIERKRYGFDK